MASKSQLNEFWGTKVGKKIRNFGGWCIANGILVGALSVLIFIFLLSNYSNLTEVGIANIFLMPIQIIISLYCFYVGIVIRKKQCTPQQLSMYTTIILLGLLTECAFLLFMNGITPGGLNIGIGLLNIAVFADCVKYKVEWHKQYLEAFGGNTHSTEKASAFKTSKQITDTKPDKHHSEEYEDDTF